MNLLCPICADTISPTEDIGVVKCGHMFHDVCLRQWFERYVLRHSNSHMTENLEQNPNPFLSTDR